MRLKGQVGHGHIVNSEGVRDGERGKRANWCDYSGPVNGKTVGVAIFDHPQNPRHPTLVARARLRPIRGKSFGEHDFKSWRIKSGDSVVPAGHALTFRYRFYFHEGDGKLKGTWLNSTSNTSKTNNRSQP